MTTDANIAALLPNLPPEDILAWVSGQLALARLLSKPVPMPVGPDHEFHDNAAIWKAVISGGLRANHVTALRDFRVCEWFPRTPGVFHTSMGQTAREYAMSRIVPVPSTTPISEANVTMPKPKGPLAMQVFDPYGKVSMLKGGVGSVRLRPKAVDGDSLWFVSATSSSIAHEGFPIAVPNDLFARLQDRLAQQGDARCDVIGRLHYLPDNLDATLFGDVLEVPRLYLRVEQIDARPAHGDDSQFRVSIPAGFKSQYEGAPQIYATYVSFSPGQKRSLEDAAEWMEETYVEGLYKGQIISDFDEQRPLFANSVLSLQKVMTQTVSATAVETLLDGTGANVIQIKNEMTFYGATVNTERIETMTNNRSVVIGNGNTINAPIVIADTIENAFNTVNGSTAADDVKALMTELIAAIAKAGEESTQTAAVQAAANDAESLAREVASEQPRPSKIEAAIADIRTAANSIGEAAKPVLSVLGRLAPLFGLI